MVVGCISQGIGLGFCWSIRMFAKSSPNCPGPWRYRGVNDRLSFLLAMASKWTLSHDIKAAGKSHSAVLGSFSPLQIKSGWTSCMSLARYRLASQDGFRRSTQIRQAGEALLLSPAIKADMAWMHKLWLSSVWGKVTNLVLTNLTKGNTMVGALYIIHKPQRCW